MRLRKFETGGLVGIFKIIESQSDQRFPLLIYCHVILQVNPVAPRFGAVTVQVTEVVGGEVGLPING